MPDQSDILNRTVELVHTLVPSQHLDQATWPAIGAIVAGGIFLFWGSRVLNTFIVLVCLGGGAYLGHRLAGRFELPQVVGMIGGGIVLALVGLYLVRMWIAGLSGLMAGAGALIAYNYHYDLTASIDRLVRSQQQPQPTAENAFPLAEPGAVDQTAVNVFDVLRLIGEAVMDNADPVLRNAAICFVVGCVLGVVVGTIAHRAAMVFWTSVAGVLLIVAGASVVLTNTWPQWDEVLAPHGRLILIGVGIAWLFGLLAQWRGGQRVMPVPPPVKA